MGFFDGTGQFGFSVTDGTKDAVVDGIFVGPKVGFEVGFTVGFIFGVAVGFVVGAEVGRSAVCIGETSTFSEVTSVIFGTFSFFPSDFNVFVNIFVEMEFLSDVVNLSYVAFGLLELKNIL